MPKLDTTVREVVDMVRRGELRLPEMQRRYVWTSSRVRDLLDSLYRGYPSGTLLVWESNQEPPARDLAVAQAKNSFMTRKLLLDGQQRVTSLCAVMNGEPVAVRNRKRPIDILFNLEHPDGPPVELMEIEDDAELPLLGNGDSLQDEEQEEDEVSIQQRLSKRTFVVGSRALLHIPTWIRVSDVFRGTGEWELLASLNLHPGDAKYQKYADRIQRLRKIGDYPYVMQVLDRGLSYEEVAEIFVRVNSLGMKLRGSDLALAQVTSRWPNSLRAFEDFAEELEDGGFSLDVGLLVRAMVVFATHQSRFKTVANISLPSMQVSWEEAKKALHWAVNFLRVNAGIEDQSLLSSPLIVLALAAFASVRRYQIGADEEFSLLQWVLIANARGHFSRGSSETILDQDLNIIFRNGMTDELRGLLLQQFGRLHVGHEDFVGRGPRSPLFATSYLALKSDGAKDWLNGLGLSLAHQGKMNFIEFHHIFPKSLLKGKFESSQINEVANMAFISGTANRRILNSEPKQYIPKIIEQQGEQALLSQAIPTDPKLWELDAFPAFLAWRRRELARRINQLMGVGQVAAEAK